MSAKILVVDDDPAIRDSIREYLAISDYNAHAAASAEEALELLRTRHFDVVITDIIMGGMDGLELAEIIKNHHDTSVIIITGYIGDYTYESAVHKGADDFVFKPVKFEELLLRLRRVLRERRLSRERMQMLEELKRISITDNLTGLYNSRHFYHQLQSEISRYKRYRRPLSLLLIDIDYFKQYNDSYGHLEGDKVLARVGGAISSELRTIDAAYRYGGEEFTVILPETDVKAAATVAGRIKKAVEYEIASPGRDRPITLSIGVTEYEAGESITEFMKRADRAMYISKEKGRNCISCILASDIANGFSSYSPAAESEPYLKN